MSKYFECKGCKEKFNIDMESSNKGYCYICNEAFMNIKISKLQNERLKKQFNESANEIRNLEQQLKEKDEKIRKLKQIVDAVNTLKQFTDKTTTFVLIDVDTYTREYTEKMKSNTKQVCEMIREQIRLCDKSSGFDWESFMEHLYLIERGEEI